MKKEKLRIIFVVCFIIIISSIILIIKYNNKTQTQLKKLGYSKDEINYILKLDYIDEILELEYDKNLVKIISEPYFIKKNLKTYLEYAKDKDDMSYVISKVNTLSNNEWYTSTKEANPDDGIKILVNKFHYLPSNFEVNDIVKVSNWYAYEGHEIRKEVYDKYVEMWYKAKEEGLTLLINSSYRTNEQQEKEYKNSNDEYASRPGFSEHQTGLALDIVTYDTIGNNFENTKEFAWLQNNSYKYGFILRYPKGKEDITGYAYESWHYRYLGVELATKVYNSGLTYDEYYAYYIEK